MPYFNLYCPNEKTYRWHTINDVKQPNNPILQSIVKQVKMDITGILSQIKGITQKMVIEAMEKYIPRMIGIQTIYCPMCKTLQVDVIVTDQTKIREDLWRSYETDRFMRQFVNYHRLKPMACMVTCIARVD